MRTDKMDGGLPVKILQIFRAKRDSGPETYVTPSADAHARHTSTFLLFIVI